MAFVENVIVFSTKVLINNKLYHLDLSFVDPKSNFSLFPRWSHASIIGVVLVSTKVPKWLWFIFLTLLQVWLDNYKNNLLPIFQMQFLKFVVDTLTTQAMLPTSLNNLIHFSKTQKFSLELVFTSLFFYDLGKP